MSAGPWRLDEDGFLISSEDQTDSAYDANDAARLLNVLTAQVRERNEAVRLLRDLVRQCDSNGWERGLKGEDAHSDAALFLDRIEKEDPR